MTQDPLARSIWDLGLSVRARSACIKIGVKTLGDLTECNAESFGEVKNCGQKTVAELQTTLTEHGLHFNGEGGDGPRERKEGSPFNNCPRCHRLRRLEFRDVKEEFSGLICFLCYVR